MGLELYGEIEPLLGFEEETDRLYDIYIEILKSWSPETLLDIGCGSGKFLLRAMSELPLKDSLGVDLSQEMVKRAKRAGAEAEALDICELNKRFEAATAIFDVLNYLERAELERFLGCVEDILEPNGLFLADINTLYGFEEVAQGALIRENEKEVLTLESIFEDGVMSTAINYFKAQNSGCYERKSDVVTQYFHEIETILDSTSLELIQTYPISLYAEEPDKELLLFKKSG